MSFYAQCCFYCSSDDNPATASYPTPVINIATQGTWRISSYINSGNSETNTFKSYNFIFGSSNVITATNGTNAYVGTWSVVTDTSNDDNLSSDLDFNIAFLSPATFADLTDDWDVVSHTATTISLIDVSGSNGGTDTLVFTKN